ncbi:MAG: bile acid:sodium symporter family protein [Bacteroidales bacterium]|jgi:predicted Na+-dependent transporter|nr:bile acid:sodium symporter family protein [Bacteroidales bacterium]
MFGNLLLKFNKVLEKAMPLVTLSGLLLGYLAGKSIAPFEFLVVPLFAFITFTSTLNMRADDFISTFKKPKFIIAFFVIFVLLQPFVAWLLSSLIFSNDPQIVIGLVLLYSTPVAVTSSIWTDIYRGNISLTITLILIGCVIAPLTTPFLILLFLGNTVEISTMHMFMSLVWMVVLPSIMGICVNEFSRGKIPDIINPVFKPFSKIALFLVVMMNAAAIRVSGVSFDVAYVYAGLLAILLSTFGFLAGFFVSGLLKGDWGTRVSMSFTSGMRNISAALVLSITYFSPRSSIPVIVGILFQQTLSAVIGSTLFGKKRRRGKGAGMAQPRRG